MYQLAAELLEHDQRMLDDDLLDSPLARHHIGAALAGDVTFSHSELLGLSALVRDGHPTRHQAKQLPVVSRREANVLLGEALQHIGTVLEHQQVTTRPPRVLTDNDGGRFGSALGMLRDGVALARAVSPALLEDLLAHVTLVGILDPQCSEQLASASSRLFPGLVLLETPSSLAVAEGLVHEGAHQKFFDLAITHDLLNSNSAKCPWFRPAWAPQGRRWPIEQTFAAWHAYACLTRFGCDAGVAEGAVCPRPGSLLPVAGERCTVIGQWLLDQGEYLGADAHALLEGVLGCRPHTTQTPQRHSDPLVAHEVVSAGLEFRRCGSSDRVLVGHPSQPPQLYWVSDDAAKLLELLKGAPVHVVVDTFAQRWQVPRSAANDRVAAILSDLRGSGLVTLQGIPSEVL